MKHKNQDLQFFRLLSESEDFTKVWGFFKKILDT